MVQGSQTPAISAWQQSKAYRLGIHRPKRHLPAGLDGVGLATGVHVWGAGMDSFSMSRRNAPVVLSAQTPDTVGKAWPGVDPAFSLSPFQVSLRPLRGAVPLWGKVQQVQYDDLKRLALLPESALQLLDLKLPLLFSRAIQITPERIGRVMYVPARLGHYVPCPIYQSSSHGSWQAPNFVQHTTDPRTLAWTLDYLGKGMGGRGKTETALSPMIQQFLAMREAQDEVEQQANWIERDFPAGQKPLENEAVKKDPMAAVKAWSGLVLNRHRENALACVHASHHASMRLEHLYPGARIDSPVMFPFPPERFSLPEEAMPNFRYQAMAYGLKNSLYGNLRGEVYASRDGKLWWTYYVQDKTQRVWVAHAHDQHSPLQETGLPQTLINLGKTIPLAPYEYFQILPRAPWPRLPKNGYVDIWRAYTAELPLVKAYYQAKDLPCPD